MRGTWHRGENMTDIDNQCTECFLTFKGGEESFNGSPEEGENPQPCCPSCGGYKIVTRRVDGKIQGVTGEKFKHY